MPNDLARQDAWKDMHFDLLGSWSECDLIRPDRSQNLKLIFQGQKVRASNQFDKANTMVSLSFSYLSYQKSYQLKLSHLKTIIFHWMTSGVKTVDMRSNLIKKPCLDIKRALHFFLILPSYHTLGENTDCSRQNHYYLKIWNLVTSGDLNINMTWK